MSEISDALLTFWPTCSGLRVRGKTVTSGRYYPVESTNSTTRQAMDDTSRHSPAVRPDPAMGT